ncbi:MAG: MarR family transcriptional regulator [Candidatus Heimdallarchaeota archaeon]
MKRSFKKLLLLILFIISLISAHAVFAIYISDSFLTTNNVTEKRFSSFESQLIKTDTLNDIVTVKVTCYLHLRTAQVQLDIDFLGADFNQIKTKNGFYTTIEEISIFGDIRSVQVIESGSIELEHSEIIDSNSTRIQFTLSSDIPIGFTRNVKITYIQDTDDFLTFYNYQLGVDWLRRIGNQNVIIICDKGISLMNCLPSPHSISTVSDKLVLSWLEANRYSFYANVNYTSLVEIDDLIISPHEWDIGRARKDSKPLEKVFAITNSENQKLDGTIIKPDWVETNLTDWELNIGETIYLNVTIDRSISRNCDCNVSLQCSIASFPVNIEISGFVSTISIASIIAIALSSAALVGLLTFEIMYYYRKRTKGRELELAMETYVVDLIENIDLDKWKEILTEREFTIFQIILDKRELTQADLVRQTTLSKSTISRAVGRLVAKGLVKKVKYGMSNVISLETDFFKNS